MPRWSRHALAFVVAAGAWLGGARVARAGGGTTVAVENPIVEVYVEGDGPEIEDAVARGVARVGAAVDFVRAARAPRLGGDRFARVDVRIDAADVKVAIVFARGGTASRSVPRSATKAVESEEIALVVESALESELDAIRETPVPAPPPPPPAPKNPEAPRPPAAAASPAPRDRGATLALFGGVLGGVGAFAEREGAVFRLGGELGVASSGKLRPAVAIRAFYTLPSQSGAPRAAADASVVNLRVMPSAQIVELAQAAFGIGAGVGVDIVSVSPRSDTARAALEPVSVRAIPVVSPTVFGRIAISKSVSLSASFALDVGLSSPSWYAAEGPARTEVLDPLRVRPVGLVGVDFALFGDDRVGRVAPEEGR